MQPNEHLYIHWRRKVMADRFSDLFSLNGIPYTEDDGENWPAGAIDTWSLDRPGEDLVDNKYKAVPPDLLESYKAVFSKIGFNARSHSVVPRRDPATIASDVLQAAGAPPV
jgi:hypothetical protein